MLAERRMTTSDPATRPVALAADGVPGLGSSHDDEFGLAPIVARSYWGGVWRRLRRDRVAVAGGIFIVVLVIVAFAGAPIAAHFLGHGPNDPAFVGGLDKDQFPAGPWTWVGYPGDQELYILGADSTLPRDEFLRLLYGAQVSLEVGIGATIFTIGFGLILGAIAGFYGGWLDTIISRAIEVTLALPYLLMVIALGAVLGDTLRDVTFGFLGRGVVLLVVVFSLLGWFYPARLFRGVVLPLREKEFIEAARMVGASNMRIIRSHILPHLVGPLMVYSTLSVATFVVAEAGLSFLGLGIPLPTASWGSLLSDSSKYLTHRPLLMVWPGVILLFTVLSFNLLGDGLRDAFDPRGSR